VHHRFDQVAKNILRDALSRACTAETEVEVLAATQKIDVYTTPDPGRAAERARMGLLGELPRTQETLLLRLLGRGRTFRQALADLAALPGDAWEQSVATPLLVHFKLGSHEHPTNEEDNVSAEIQAWFEDYQSKLRRESHKEGERSLLLRQLRSRFGELPAAAVARIEAADVADIERWGERILGARTLAEVLDEQP
jgi:hypothetical protein